MKTLSLIDRVGESIVGTALFSPRFTGVQVGLHTPLVRKGEDAEGLLRAGFLSPGAPLELNILSTRTVRQVLQRSTPIASLHTDWISPPGLFHSRPSIAYVPPETLTNPSDAGIKALASTGTAGAQVATVRKQSADGTFWTELAKRRLYPPWLRELLMDSRSLGVSLLAPPVPVVTRDVPGAAILQAQLNLGAASIRLAMGPDPAIPGIMYSLYLHPSALSETSTLRMTIQQLSHVIGRADNAFWGVHMHFTDLGAITTQGAGRIQAAKDVVREVSRLAADAGIFTWVSDAGAVGPAILDEGPAFTSYHPGLSPHKIYSASAPGSTDVQCGKVIELWDYNLKLRSDLGKNGWKVDDTGLFPNTVPSQFRMATPRTFRLDFGKPNNVAVAERLNSEREKELIKNGNTRPGQAHVGKSKDFRIVPWA
jgi:hypothetical protein